MGRAEQRPDQCFNDKCRISNKLALHHHYYYYYLLLLLSFRPSTRELSSATWWIGPVVLTVQRFKRQISSALKTADMEIASRETATMTPPTGATQQELIFFPTALKSARLWVTPTVAGCPPSCLATIVRAPITVATCTSREWTRCRTLSTQKDFLAPSAWTFLKKREFAQ
ncbi:uncharacterized protein [Sinocyclocheilus grahami]|uniref:uncharacterized protein isoform X2 n=1 Tax=Sinocyclocheilus grahami TaxID=75366 RepID=UPI0007AD002C|nr:PREDICTED: uncharacterized protein LOC107564018 isoform X2 [Sinocyclocheilus grahami]